MTQQQYLERLLARLLVFIQTNFQGDCLCSVILTGSLGRGEPTFFPGENDEPILKSDVEIGLVYSGYRARKHVNALVHAARLAFTEELNILPLQRRRVLHAHNANYSILSPRWKALFTYDLYFGSKTIWGEDLLTCNSINVTKVDPYEAKRLVANRIGELIYLHRDLPSGLGGYRLCQWKSKILLAIGSAFLLLNGEYTPSFYEQSKTLWARVDEVQRVFGTLFLKEYTLAHAFLRKGGPLFDAPEEALRNYVAIADALFKQRGLTRSRVNSLSRTLRYAIQYIRTDMDYGLLSFEERILQTLITKYATSDPSITRVADIWRKTLYG